MHDLSFASIATLQDKLLKKEISAPEMLSFFANRFAQYDSTIGSALEIFEQSSILEASAHNGPLFGVPGLLKDNICQKGRIASCASKILEHYKAPYDATVALKLKNAGALLLGRANMDEFAMGSSTETSAYKKTKNPWDITRVPGGSSGGSAAAVAAGFVPWALGSETGGSVRQPASWCGIVGMKPTYGLVSRYGLVAYGSSLDQIGVFSRTIADNALILSTIAGEDANDSTTRKHPSYTYQDLNGKLPESCTIGVIDNALETDGMDPEVTKALQEALRLYESLGARIKHIRLPSMDYGAAVYFMISRAEAASNLARFDGVKYGFRSKKGKTLDELYDTTRAEGFGWEVKRRILLGNYVLSAGHADEYYVSAKTVQGLMRDEFTAAFTDVDVLFAPVSPMPAFTIGAFDDNKLAMDLQDYFTAPANLVGIPALSIPCGFTSNNLPIGFQLMGPELSEHMLYKIGQAYELATEWHKKYPKLAL